MMLTDTHTKFLKGAPLAKQIKASVSVRTERWKTCGVHPKMAVVAATDDPAVEQYQRINSQNAEKLGIDMRLINLGVECTQEELESRLEELSNDRDINGILLSLPLAPHLHTELALARIPAQKDVDGMTVTNLGHVLAGREDQAIVAATPKACLALAESTVSLMGKRVVVVGAGRTVGKVLIPLLINREATVTVCHARTEHLADIVKEHEIVFVAVGKARLIGPKHLRDGQLVIDAGINISEQGVVGDVDTNAVLDMVSKITPVPGGVGPLTSSLVFHNLMQAMVLQYGDTDD
ncbi:MAG: bifunctional 5,10-methylenetetrahydrofolate dehydrogenase/5,10-methenyltetrahydrofolate cyclohydrolase [Pseudomonadota bacterium]